MRIPGRYISGLIRIRITGYILLFLFAISPAVTAQNSPNKGAAGDESERIRSLENAWNQADTRHDAAAMSMLVGDPFAYTDEDGSFMNRAQFLLHVKNGIDQYEQLGNTEMTVHLYGNVAVVAAQYHEKIKTRGKWAEQFGRFTDTWIRQNDEWKCVASQSTVLSH